MKNVKKPSARALAKLVTAPATTDLVPVSGRAQQREWSSLATIEATVGGRDALRAQLEFAAPSPKQDHFLSLLGDPARQNDSLRSLCAHAGLTPFDLMEMIQETHLARAAFETKVILADGLPGVMTSVVAQATDRYVVCTCTVAVGSPDPMKPDPHCRQCKGTGKLFREGSFDHQEMLFKAGKLLPKDGGITVDNSNKTLVMGQGAAMFDAFVKQTDLAVATPAPAAVDADFIEDTDGRS